MKRLFVVRGLDRVIRNLKAADATQGRKFSTNLHKAGRYLQRKSMKLVPVQVGNLKGSAYTRRLGSGWQTEVIVGYTSPYAVVVHEDLDKAHGRVFNAKYASLIATRGLRAQRAKASGASFTAESDPYFKRGEDQQAKFLEQPAKDHRANIFRIVAGKKIV